jgi:hypothetical protein
MGFLPCGNDTTVRQIKQHISPKYHTTLKTPQTTKRHYTK